MFNKGITNDMKRRVEKIQRLKGNLSKVLTIRTTLRPDERSSLEKIFWAVDKFILSPRDLESKKTFEKVLSDHVEVLYSTKRFYVRDHIVPLITEVIKDKE